MQSERSELGKDQIFEVLSNSRRRRLIYLLYHAGGEGDLRDLAREIASAEQDTPADEDQYKRLYISLYQTHVPKLEEYGIVEYNSDTKQVTLTDRVDQVISIFHEQDKQRRWWRYYAGLAALSVGGLLVYWAAFPTNQTVSILVAFVPIALLAALVIVHFFASQRPDDTVIGRMVS